MDYFDSSAFSSTIESLMQQWHVPALAVAVCHRGEIKSKAFGYADLKQPRPCTADTIFDIASSSKSLTAASVALLVADNETYPDVQWDTPVSKLLPDDFILAEQSYTEDVRLEDILSHRSGLPSHDFSSMAQSSSHPDTIQSLTRNLRNLPLAAPIRSKYMYSNLLYTVSTHLVEELTQSSFADYLQEHFFKPLKMTSTFLQPNAVLSAGQQDRLATPYRWEPDSTTHVELEHLQCPEAQGAGSIHTSVSDYILWIQAMMMQQSPISKDVYEGLLRPRIMQNPTAAFEDLDPQTSWSMYAVGWEVRFYRGVQIVKHDGLTTGFGSNHFFIPEYNFGAVILGNSEDANDLANIVHHLLIDAVLDVPQDQRPDWNGIFSKAYDSFDVEEPLAEIKAEYLGTREDDEAQELPLSAYTGTYWNDGYKTIQVEVKDDQLFINGSDRSMPITIRLEHVCEQTKYIARIDDYFEGPTDVTRAEFKLDNSVASAVGIKLESDLEDLIWFRRLPQQ